jgi:hypothetical protein
VDDIVLFNKAVNPNDFDGSFPDMGILPVELISFDAKSSRDHVRLIWETAIEINNDYFIVERSWEGVTWHEVATVQGAGNSSILKSYSTTDHQPYDGASYYRLKQVDFDGQYTYSQSVKVERQVELQNISVFPNPTSSTLHITVVSAEVDIFDINGMNLSSEVKIAAGLQNIDIDMSGLRSGIYYLKAGSNVIKVVKK